MEPNERDDLIDTYYAAVDAADYDRMLTAFAEDVEYRYPGEGTMRGHADVRTFFEERRETRETTHEVVRRIHGEDATACEGRITGKRGETPFEGAYVGVFEFDGAGKISYVGVYTDM